MSYTHTVPSILSIWATHIQYLASSLLVVMTGGKRSQLFVEFKDHAQRWDTRYHSFMVVMAMTSFVCLQTSNLPTSFWTRMDKSNSVTLEWVFNYSHLSLKHSSAPTLTWQWVSSHTNTHSTHPHPRTHTRTHTHMHTQLLLFYSFFILSCIL